ncbi:MULTISPECIES: MFS transporter [Rhodococcus]|uniref:MFS transporter n=1 Tax=Rhodococcus TaxID=1827 RepID=UPI001E6555A5|nr:MFS transporter [Rhodococcus pyridinivorans]MCD2116352.1 MFS transporter [Rhodococcus pyridinivorans]MCZ4625220.1 MFS transporter [Rhodococcus pyridinivorans]MCZ4646261.1 MFS transporter [Rhodococcus pyridinivorans]MDJ0480742.1 MFS transporter [Rhodococcus pyridinivorans]MDV7252533.1 MFS transporter [Rhodococcus pyridinivorans]
MAVPVTERAESGSDVRTRGRYLHLAWSVGHNVDRTGSDRREREKYVTGEKGGSYRELFAAPGAAAFCLAGFVARLPIAMVGIGIVTMFSQLEGNYAVGGALSAVFALSYAVLTPLVSRAVDRYGQRRVLPTAAAVSAVATLAMLSGVRFEVPTVWLFVCGIPAGLMPTIGAMVRARWTQLYGGTPRLRTAFALEAVVDEVCFIVGPVLSVGLSVAVFPEAGPLLGAVLLLVGTLALAALRSTEPPVQPHTDDRARTNILRMPVLLSVVVVMVAMGVVFGVIDVAAVAFTAEQNSPGSATFALALFATGSAMSGLIFGSRVGSSAPTRQLFVATGTLAVLLCPLLLAGSVPMLTVLYFVAGCAISPIMIVATSLTQQIVPPDRLTESITWTVAGLGVGVAAGSALVGQVIDRTDAGTGYLVAVAAGILAVTCAGGIHVRARLE